jgi:hypothetical protein
VFHKTTTKTIPCEFHKINTKTNRKQKNKIGNTIKDLEKISLGINASHFCGKFA